MRIALTVLLFASPAAAQRLGCDPVGYPPDACGRLPDGCGGFVDLRPCPVEERFAITDVGVWTIGGAPLDTPAFATDLGARGPDASWIYASGTGAIGGLTVRVRYPGGRAAWVYPAPARRGGTIEWRGGAGPPPDGGAWTTIALGVARSIGDGMVSNAVLMHAGTVRFRSPIDIRDGEFASARGEHSIFSVGARGFEELRVFGRQRFVVRSGDGTALRQRLFDELVDRGLREVEANALLDARTDLTSGDRAHHVYFLPREEIDRAQPIDAPRLSRLTRVRLVADYR